MLARDPNAYVIRAAGPCPTCPAMPNHVTNDLYGITSQRHVASIFAAHAPALCRIHTPCSA